MSHRRRHQPAFISTSIPCTSLRQTSFTNTSQRIHCKPAPVARRSTTTPIRCVAAPERTRTDDNFVPHISPKPTPHDLATGRDPSRVKFFDTTLRDGEQSPGASLNTEEKMVIARQLAKLGVDVIEAGFPVASPGDFEAVRSIAKAIGTRDDPPIICGLARAVKKDIDRCWEAIKYAAFPRIHTFIATSDVHMKHKLRKSREEVLSITKEMVSHAKSLCEDVEFSAEDATRSEPEFLCKIYSTAIEAGATTINVPDTVGYTTPGEFGDLIRTLRKDVKGIENVTISVHGHNDLGLAVANFMSAISNGARQVECTINGIGERAGNASLEEIAMALHVRKSYYNPLMGKSGSTLATNINHQEIFHTSRMVSTLTGMTVQANKAIVGANAFAHESGIHQDGILKNRLTYEIMDAKSIGLDKNSLILGKHSGRHAFRSRLEQMGYECNENELNRSFARFKELADKKKAVSQLDLESIVNDEIRAVTNDIIKLVRVQVQCGNFCVPTATITVDMTSKGPEVSEEDRMATVSSTGTGPVDAAFQALNKVVKHLVDVTLEEYVVNSVTEGIDALGEVTVRVIDGASGRRYTGSSSNTDVVVASATAYANAINRCSLASRSPDRIHPQLGGANGNGNGSESNTSRVP